MRLQEKVVIITGAGSGIGKASALLFAQQGATIIVNDISSDKGYETVNEIVEQGGKAQFIHADVTDATEVKAMVESIINSHGKIDVLFNNAGISGVGAIHEIEPDVWDRVININIRGVYLPSKYVIPYMMEQKNGSIINMSSCIAEIGLARRASYAATKGAVLSLTKSMQVDYAPYGIRINALLPGTVLTPFVEQYLRQSYDDIEAGYASLKRRQLSGDLLRPDDIAQAALFLASDESKYMMGSPLYIDGGVVFGKNS